MFRRLLTQSPRRSAATGLVALTALYGGAALAPSSSATPDVVISISAPLRQFLSSTSDLFLRDFTLSYLFSTPSGGLNFKPIFPSSIPLSGSSKETSRESRDDGPSSPGCMQSDTIAKAAAAACPALVHVSVAQGPYGSGTIIDPDGTILTSASCVAESLNSRKVSKSKIGVTLQDGRELEGTVVIADFLSDIAIVKIQSETPLPTARIGSSSKIRPGDQVIALGTPQALQNTITSGIVSCTDRDSNDLGLGSVRREHLPTDCAINTGSLGGPLVNLDGEVVGVNTADGMSFAVPIDIIMKIIEQFEKNERVIRPRLGMKVRDLNERKIAHFKKKDASFPDVIKGVQVCAVNPGSPAQHAGLRPGDVVIEFDKKPVGTAKEIIDIMEDQVGKTLEVLIKRADNTSMTLTVMPKEAKTMIDLPQEMLEDFSTKTVLR
ncbi:putative protease Do-like 14 [Musa acuminata AAA Group]|uniref:putative protease Do-like 14 n=1 Tax=Musa acuminata AAA Group TaxID=214697 RepID=UPI0031D662C5